MSPAVKPHNPSYLKLSDRSEQHVRDVMDMRDRAADRVMDWCRSGASPSTIRDAILSLPLFVEPKSTGDA